jgi:hypothetical protein
VRRGHVVPASESQTDCPGRATLLACAIRSLYSFERSFSTSGHPPSGTDSEGHCLKTSDSSIVVATVNPSASLRTVIGCTSELP